MAPDDALVRILEHLDAISAAILGRLAGYLRGRERVRQRVFGAADRRDAHADRDFERTLARRAARWPRPLARISLGYRWRPPPCSMFGISAASRSPEMRADSAPRATPSPCTRRR